MTKRKKIGYQIADGIIASITLYYNHQTQNSVLHHVIERLQEFAGQFEAKKQLRNTRRLGTIRRNR